MRLAELQQAVQAYVLDEAPPSATLVAAVAPPAAERWDIYADGYRLRLAEALAGSYPVLRTRLGEAAFTTLARAFIAATPSTHRSIRDYGAELGAHLARGATTAEEAMRAELASFEWQLAAAFDAEDARPAGVEELATLGNADWPALRFAPVPSLRRLATASNAVAVWRALRQDEPALAPEPCPEPLAALTATSTEWLIARRALVTEFRSLDGAEAAALDQLLAGATFGELCGRVAESLGDNAALQAASWLKGWLLAGLLLRV
jgi:hypothetical protein